VGGNRAYLRQHVLVSVENAPAGAQYRLLVVEQIPGETNARLDHAFVAGQSAVRGEQRIAEEPTVRGLGGRNHRVREQLPFPTQAIVQREVAPWLPLVLYEERDVFVGNVREAGRIGGRARQASSLQVEQKRSTAGCAPWARCRSGYIGSVRATDSV